MRYTIYKITNTTNDKYYVGKHQTKNPNDSYLGSGIAITRAIKEYGRGAFVKEILFDFDTEDEMNAKERELVTEQLVSDPTCYNVSVGGEGGPHFRGRKHTEEAKAKMNPGGRVTSPETRSKIGAANSRRSEEVRRGNRRKTAKLQAFNRD